MISKFKTILSTDSIQTPIFSCLVIRSVSGSFVSGSATDNKAFQSIFWSKNFLTRNDTHSGYSNIQVVKFLQTIFMAISLLITSENHYELLFAFLSYGDKVVKCPNPDLMQHWGTTEGVISLSGIKRCAMRYWHTGIYCRTLNQCVK